MLTQTVSGRTFTYSYNIGRQTRNGEGFRFPVDVALAPEEVLYVLNYGDEDMPSTRVTKCTLGEDFLEEFGGPGSRDGQFMRATSIDVDIDSNVYVADEWLNRISIFDKDGSYLDKWGTPGSGDGQLCRPSGLCFDREDYLWVVDSGNNRIQKFTRDGKVVDGWGRGGTGDGEFNMPWGITIDNGDVYVADWFNSRVQKFSPDGKYLMSFGAPGSGQGELTNPSGVAVDEEGDVYVADWGASQLVAYAPDGAYLTTFIGDAQDISKWAGDFINANPDYLKARRKVKNVEQEWRLSYPSAVEIDDQRRIVIVDTQRNRLQIYIKEKDYVDPQFNL